MKLLDDFRSYLHSVQRSEGTVDSYTNNLHICFIWNLKNNDNKSFINWTKRNIISLQNWLINDNQNSSARVRQIKASLSSFSNFIENVLDDEYPNFRNIIKKIENPVATPRQEKTVLEENQIKELLMRLTLDEEYEKACAVALALYSGRRKSELARFRVSDFGDDHLVCNGALYKSNPIKTKGRGVTGKMLECYTLAAQFRIYLDNYLQYREENGIRSEWLLPDTKDPSKPVRITVLNHWTASFSAILKVDFYWHAMRHLTVTNFKRAGIPDSVIKTYIGWENLGMVDIYSDIKSEEQLGMYFNGHQGICLPEKKDFSEI